jgi:hypothetical protein
MKQHTQSKTNALILTARLNDEFGFAKARLVQELLVLTYHKVNKHCKELVARCLLVSNRWRRIYLRCSDEAMKPAQEIRTGVIESRYDLEFGSRYIFDVCHRCTDDETTGRIRLKFCSKTVLYSIKLPRRVWTNE